MEKSKMDDKSREISGLGEDDHEDLDIFIEKRKIQNEALKKIVKMMGPLEADVRKKGKGK